MHLSRQRITFLPGKPHKTANPSFIHGQQHKYSLRVVFDSAITAHMHVDFTLNLNQLPHPETQPPLSVLILYYLAGEKLEHRQAVLRAADLLPLTCRNVEFGIKWNCLEGDQKK